MELLTSVVTNAAGMKQRSKLQKIIKQTKSRLVQLSGSGGNGKKKGSDKKNKKQKKWEHATCMYMYL